MSVFDPKIRTKTPSRNRFNLSYYTRLTSRMGDLVPAMCKKVVPSDRFKVSMSSITRLAPLANPIYDRVRIDFDAFFVQNRIIDPDWKSFITGGEGLYGETSTEGMEDIRVRATFVHGDSKIKPFIGAGSLVDYLGFQFADYGTDGLPVTSDSQMNFGLFFNALPVLGYHKIWQDWYRNERFDEATYDVLMDSAEYNPVSRSFLYVFASTGSSTVDKFFNLHQRRYGKDPYTTALAEPLIGGPVPIMTGMASVGNATANLTTPFVPIDVTQSGTSITLAGSTSFTGSGELKADLSTAVGNTIQQLNQAYRLFSFFMKDTYNGNRYVEFIESHFNVRVPDATLERPIFLGRHTQWLNFSEIYQTSGATSESNQLGDYAGMGISSGSGFLFDQTFDEHGYIYVIMSIRPNNTYFQGANQEFFYGDRFSYFFPEFQNIGDDAISVYKLYNSLSSSAAVNVNLSSVPTGSQIFGYNRRWYDYIWYKDEMHGYFLLDNQLYNWTFARKYTNTPVLGSDFVAVPSINNPFTYRDLDNQNYYTDIFFKISALRPIERYESF